MTIAINSVRSTRFVLSGFLLLLSLGVVSRPAIANPSPNTPIVIAETLTAEQFRERGDQRSTEDVKGAIEDYTKAIQLAPKEIEYYIARGMAYFRNNDKVRALADYGQAIKISPDIADGYYARAIFYCEEGNYPKAIADWDQAVKRVSSSVSLSQRADCLVKSGDHKGAIVGYTDSIEWSAQAGGSEGLIWGDAITFISRGKSYQAIGNSNAAIADFDKALTVKKDDFANIQSIRGDAYHQRALVKLSLGQKQAALQDFQQAAKSYGSGDEYDQIMKSIKELQ